MRSSDPPRFVWLAVLLLASCSGRRVELLDPEQDRPVGATSMILAIEQLGKDARVAGVRAVDLESPESEYALVDVGDDPVRVSQLFYAQSLEELGMKLGVLEPVAVGISGSPLPDFDSARQRVADADTIGPWEAVDDLQDPLGGFRIPSTEPTECPLSTSVVEVSTPSGLGAAVALDEDTLLVFTDWAYRPYEAFLVTRSGSQPVIVPRLNETFGANANIFEAAVTADGRIWLSVGLSAPYRGHLYVGTLSDGFEPVVTQRSVQDEWGGEWMRWIHARGEWLYTQTDYGRVHRYHSSEDRWELLSPGPAFGRCFLDGPKDFCADLVDDGERILAPSPNGDGSIQVLSSTPSETFVPQGSGAPVTAVAYGPLGLTAARSDKINTGLFVSRTAADDWEELPDSPAQLLQVFSMAPFRSGVLLGGAVGSLRVHTGARLCPPPVEGGFANSAITQLVPMPGGTIVAISGPGDQSETKLITFIDP